jgi:pyruvate kinase
MPFTKIVATLGPATTDPPVLADLLAAGVDVVRINCSHGVIGDHVAEVGLVHRVAKEVGRRVAVVADLQGPKMRVGSIPGAGVELDRGGSSRASTRISPRTSAPATGSSSTTGRSRRRSVRSTVRTCTRSSSGQGA